MYLDLNSALSREICWSEPRLLPMWSVLIPFFNERDYLGATIASLAAQTIRPAFVLVDNGSTDGSADVARAVCQRHGVDFVLISERIPGKVAALSAGLSRVGTQYVATCDADTIYPPHYLAEAQHILEKPGCTVAGAYYIAPTANENDRIAKARAFLAMARLLPRQSHTGGAGQAFRTAALRSAGGFDAGRWHFVLEDHEVIHRTMKLGSMRYSSNLWCVPSTRDRDRGSIRWTLFERLLYSAVAPWAGDWFFYSFLARRLRVRALLSNRIRERQFQTLEGPAFATSHSVF